jgi:predicted O-methyltransferase YrrM
VSTGKVAFVDKLLPDQPEHTYYYDGDGLMRALYDVICHASGIASPREEFVLEESDELTVEEMASSPVSLRFFQLLVRVSGARRVLEIGSFIGVSAMCFARALPEDGEVVTIEKCERFARIARRNFERNGLGAKIRLLQADAMAVLGEMPRREPFDIVFIDGNKERYREYMEQTAPLLAPRGLMIVDDAFFHGDAVNAAPKTEKGRGVKAALDRAADLDGWLRVVLPMANGILLLVRK